MTKTLEIPSSLTVMIAETKLHYSTVEFVRMMTGMLKRGGHKDVTDGDVKIEIWKVLNGVESSGVVAEQVKKRIVLEEK